MKTKQTFSISSVLGPGKIILAIIVVLTMYSLKVNAQWNPNTSVNLLLSSFTDDVQLAAPTTDGKTWIAFYSQTAGNYAMRAQLVDANGYKLLGPDGIIVSNQPSGSATFVFNICLDASNNLIIAMQDQRTGSMKACMYKIDQAGNHLWSTDGVVLGAGLAPNPTVLTTGETVVCWDESVSGTLNLQKVSVAGAAVWATPIQVKVGTSKTTRGQIVANSAGKFTMVYQKKGVGISTSLYAQTFDNAGVALYTALQISNQTSSGARYYSILSDADTTYFGYYVSAGSRFNSFLQRINPGGTIPWGMNGSNFNTATASTDNYQMTTDINMQPGSNYIYSVCNFCNTLQSQYGIYVQKFLKTTGTRLFTDAAKVVYPITTARDQHVDRIAMITDGPMFLGYSDVDYKMYAVRLDASGNFVWPGNKVELSSTTASAGTPKMRYNFTPIGPYRCAGVWTENRGSGYRGYGQGVSIGGLLGIKVATQGNVPAVIATSGGTLQVVDTVFPLTANQSATWSIVNGTGIASISATGLVTAITNGTVWAKAVAVQDNTVKDSLLITMSNQLITSPTVITSAATSVTSNTAVLNGMVTANFASTTVTFNWGLTPAYGNTVTATPSTVTGTTPTPVVFNLSGLIPGTTYHFRASGVNIAGTMNGADFSFTTALATPDVLTTVASNVGNTSAQINGSVNANNASTTVSFEWGLTTAYGNTIAATPSPVTGYGATPVLANLSGLVWGSTYHFRCKGVNSVGPNYGADFSFTTGCPLPLTPGPLTGSLVVCQNQNNVAYSIPADPNATNYIWTVPSGASIVTGAGTNSITVNYTVTAVSGNITVTSANNCATGPTASFPITVNPVTVPTISGPNSICATSGYNTYTAQSGMSNYSWTVSSGGSIFAGAGTSYITVYWSTPGPQTVSVIFTNANGCQVPSPTVYNVTVNGVPSAAGAITGPGSVCAGAQGVSYSVAPVAGALAYAWSVPTGATIVSGANTNSIAVDFAVNAVSGQITVSGNNLCGNGSASSLGVNITPVPAGAGTITGPASVCKGDAGVVYTVPPVLNATAYTWTVPTGVTVTSGANTNSITVTFGSSAVSGPVSVYGTNTCGNGASSSLNLTVNAIPPTPSITSNGYVLTSSAASGNQWYHDGTAVTGATSQTYTVPATEPGWYWTIVTLTGCSSDSSNNIYIQGVGVDEHLSGNMNIYPVPNNGQFTIAIRSEQETSYTIQVFNSMGVKVYGDISLRVSGNSLIPVDLGKVAAGLYTVILRNAGNQAVRKITVN